MISLVLGCSKSGAPGCNPSERGRDSGSTATAAVETVDSQLPGVYEIERYQGSQDACDQLVDIPSAPTHLVLYGFRRDEDSDEVRLGGAFCDDVSQCRALASEAGEPAIGYSFIAGDDASGWEGWAISRTGSDNEQCGADVQSHQLTLEAAQAVRITTKTVHTVFPPVVEDQVATCHNKDAIKSVNDNLACQALLVLEASREADL